MMAPEEFKKMLNKFGIRAAQALPIPVPGVNIAYWVTQDAERARDTLLATYREAYDAAQSKNNAALRSQIGAYTPIVPSLQAEDYKMITRLINEVRQIAENGYLPDGDHVNAPTAMWFEEWADTLEGICLFRRSRDAEAATNDCIEAGYNDA